MDDLFTPDSVFRNLRRWVFILPQLIQIKLNLSRVGSGNSSDRDDGYLTFIAGNQQIICARRTKSGYKKRSICCGVIGADIVEFSAFTQQKDVTRVRPVGFCKMRQIAHRQRVALHAISKGIVQIFDFQNHRGKARRAAVFGVFMREVIPLTVSAQFTTGNNDIIAIQVIIINEFFIYKIIYQCNASRQIN